MKRYEYMGQTIAPCERASGEHRGRWVVMAYHESGLPWSDDLLTHHHTLAEAKESIRFWNEARRLAVR